MRIIIIGAGEVGYHLARFLSREKDVEVVVVDTDSQKLKRINEEMDIAVVEGEGGSPEVLKEAGADVADILLAVTNSDETNMIACLVAKALFNIKRKIARIRNREYYTNSILLAPENLDINPAINPEMESAKAILRIIDAPFAYDVEEFENGQIKVLGFKVEEDSIIAGKTLMEFREKTKENLLIGIIQRQEKAIIPRGKDRVFPGDIIYLPVHKDDVSRIASILTKGPRQVKKLMIVGGGRIGFMVASELEEKDITVKVIEKNPERCKYLSRRLKNAIVLHGDGSDRTLLEEENIQDMDMFAALSNNEELNIMSSLLAKRLGVRKVITLVNRTDYINLANNLGIEVVISPRLITASRILRYVRRGDILSLTAIAEDMAEIIEAKVGKTSKFLDRPLKKSHLPKTALVGAIVRGTEVIIPGGDDYIKEDDRLIIFTLREAIKQVEEFLV
jgi:trk system potassium uptake protein TrkA